MAGGLVDLRFDVREIEQLGALLQSAAKQVPQAVANALNRTAIQARTQVKRALVAQTGLPSSVVLKALRVQSAKGYALSAALIAVGRYVPLREFRPVQGGAGVTAAPWGKRQLFHGAFIVNRLGGHVFARKGKERLPIHMLYGPAIPVEMVREHSESVMTFFATVPPVLAKRLEHELGRLIGAQTPEPPMPTE